MPVSSPFNPQSPLARDISGLFILILVVGGIILALVLVLVLYASFRYRERPGDKDEPRQVLGNLKLEIGWTVAPAVLLAVLFGLTVRTMARSDPPAPAANQQPDILVVGHQWWWEVVYPKSGVTTANEIHIPVDKRMLVQLKSADVIHDLWVPQLGRKMDATPGHPTYMWLQADEPNTYLGSCSEYCGTQHAWMRVRIVAQPQAEFDAWQQRQAEVPQAPTSSQAAEGARLFQDSTCVNCHTIAGTPAEGKAGPDLTHFGGRETLGAGVLDNTPDNLARWLTDPQAVKPGILMPNMNLSKSEVDALVAYLESLK
jgi:cytochrome c oxidase subunit 2